MEDYYINNNSQDYSSYYNDDYNDYNEVGFMYVATCIIIAIGLPLTLMTIPALYSQVRNDHVAPIYVINLLISDLLQYCCMIVEVARPENVTIQYIFIFINLYGLAASLGFMVCIALERYLVIVFPVWYSCRRGIKSSVVICVMVWALSAPHPITVFFSSYDVGQIINIVFFVLPLPPLIFFLVGTLKALSASISVKADEKQRIVGTLVLVLLIYTLLFLPNTIWAVLLNLPPPVHISHIETLWKLCAVFLRLSPLADLVLYIFMKKGAVDKLLASLCCCRMESNDVISIPV